MFQRIGFIALLFGAVAPATTGFAKPADLPGNVQQQCPEGRDGQHADGFTPRPDAVEMPRPFADRDLGNRGPIDRSRDLDRARPQRNTDTGEEQEAPPARMQYREPTERRSTPGQTAPRYRNTDRRTSDDQRRQEMLRSTQPLDTVPQRPADEGGTLHDQDLQPVQEYEVPPVQFTEPLNDDFDDLIWLPPSTRKNLRAYASWNNARSLPPIPVLPALPTDGPTKEVQVASPRVRPESWTPGFELQGGFRWGLANTSNAKLSPEFESLLTNARTTSSTYPHICGINLPWGQWTIRFSYGIFWFDWSQPCNVELSMIEVRGFSDCSGSCTGMQPPTFVGADVTSLEHQRNPIGMSQVFVRNETLACLNEQGIATIGYTHVRSFRGVAVSLSGVRNSAGILDSMNLVSRPLLLMVYPANEARGFLDSDVSAPSGPIGDFDFTHRPIF